MNRISLLKFVDRLLGPAAVWQAARGMRRYPRGDDGRARATGPVLIIRPGGIGDAVVLLEPLVALRAALPSEIRLDVLCEPRNRAVFDLAAPPGVRVLSYTERPLGLARRLRRAGYAAVLDTEQSHWFSAVFTAWTRAPVRIGFDTVPRRSLLYTESVPYDPRGPEREQFARLLAALRLGVSASPAPSAPFAPRWPTEVPASADRYVVVHVGGSNASKRWPAERYAELCAALRQGRGLRCVLVGGTGDRAEAARVVAHCASGEPPENAVGRLSLAETWALCARAALFVGTDSGIAHLADFSGTPAVVLFGSGDPAKWGPRHGCAVTASPPAACAPCSRYGTLYRRRGCRYECVALIEPSAVLAAADALLSTPEKTASPARV